MAGISMEEHGSEEAERDIPKMEPFWNKGEIFHYGFSDGWAEDDKSIVDGDVDENQNMSGAELTFGEPFPLGVTNRDEGE